jgi:hypothetical protein
MPYKVKWKVDGTGPLQPVSLPSCIAPNLREGPKFQAAVGRCGEPSFSSSASSNPSFTRLDPRIIQEENLFTVTVRLFDHRRQGEGAWGEEITTSVDSASRMIDAIAQKYSISQKHISISIVMENFTNGTSLRAL